MILNFILYIVLVIYGAIFSVLYNEYQILVMVAVAAIFPVISWILNTIGLFLLQVRVEADAETMNKTEKTGFSVIIKNKSLIPISVGKIRVSYGLLYGKKKEKRWIKFSVGARSTEIVHIDVACERCGYLEVKVDRIKIYDYFKVFHMTRFGRHADKVLVYPDVNILSLAINKQQIYGNEEEDGFEPNVPGDDPSQVFDFREYREGDKLQRVHWKLSTKRGRLIVREFSKPIIINTAILVDFYRNRKVMEDEFSKQLETVASVCYTLLKQKIKFYVMWVDRESNRLEKILVDSEEQFYILIGNLAQQGATDKDLLSMEYKDLKVEYSNLFYVGDKTQEILKNENVKAEVM